MGIFRPEALLSDKLLVDSIFLANLTKTSSNSSRKIAFPTQERIQVTKGYIPLAFHPMETYNIYIAKRQTRRETGAQSHGSRLGRTARPPMFCSAVFVLRKGGELFNLSKWCS
jgi:hypothetical protein